MNEFDVEQPRQIAFIGRLQAVFWLGALGYLLFYTLRTFGNFSWKDLPLIGVASAFNVIAWVQLLLKIRKLTVKRDGIEVFYFGGRRRWILWEDFDSAELIDAVPGKNARLLLRVFPKSGSKLQIDDRMSNFNMARKTILSSVSLRTTLSLGPTSDETD